MTPQDPPPKIVPEPDVQFDDRHVEPDRLEEKAEQPTPVAGQPTQYAGDMPKVTAAFRSLVHTLPGFRVYTNYADIPKEFDPLIPHITDLEMRWNNQQYETLVRFRIVKNDTLIDILSKIYGSFIAKTDLLSGLPPDGYSACINLADRFPEFRAVCSKSVSTDGLFLTNPYLMVLMADHEKRAFIYGLFEEAESQQCFKDLAPYERRAWIGELKSPLSHIPLKTIIQYAEKTGETHVQQYIDALRDLPTK